MANLVSHVSSILRDSRGEFFKAFEKFSLLCYCTIVLAIIIQLIQIVKRGRKIFSKAEPGMLLVSIHHLLEKNVTKGVQFCNLSSFLPLSREKKNRSVPIDKAASFGIMNIEGRCRMAVSPDPSNRDFHVDRSGTSRAVNTLLGLSTPAAATPPPATPYSAGLSSNARFPSASPPFARERPTAFLCSSVLLHVIIAPTPYLVKFRARQGPFFYGQRNTEMCPESF